MKRLALFCLTLFACAGEPKVATAPPPPPSAQCSADGSVPSISESKMLPTGTTGGPNAWFDAKVSWPGPASEHHLLLDGVEIPIVRVKKPRAPEKELNPTGGQLTPRDVRAKPTPLGEHDIVSFRIPPNTSQGKHQLLVKTCGAVAPEGITIDVLPSPAPIITNVHFVRGEQWQTLFINGRNLFDAEEVILVNTDDAISSIPHVTPIDSEHIKTTLDTIGNYEVFVRTKSGIGGGPPGGVIRVH